MTLLLKQLLNFIQLLNSDKGTYQIAAGVACGLILGLTPAFSLQTLVVFACIFFFRIQLGAALITSVFFTIPAFLLDPVFDRVGTWVLEAKSLHGLFTTLYNMPIVPLTRFNNTVVMGSGVVSIVLAPIAFFVSVRLVEKYREEVVARFKNTPLWKAFTASTIYNWYSKINQIRSLRG